MFQLQTHSLVSMDSLILYVNVFQPTYCTLLENMVNLSLSTSALFRTFDVTYVQNAQLRAGPNNGQPHRL